MQQEMPVAHSLLRHHVRRYMARICSVHHTSSVDFHVKRASSDMSSDMIFFNVCCN